MTGFAGTSYLAGFADTSDLAGLPGGSNLAVRWVQTTVEASNLAGPAGINNLAKFAAGLVGENNRRGKLPWGHGCCKKSAQKMAKRDCKRRSTEPSNLGEIAGTSNNHTTGFGAAGQSHTDKNNDNPFASSGSAGQSSGPFSESGWNRDIQTLAEMTLQMYITYPFRPATTRVEDKDKPKGECTTSHMLGVPTYSMALRATPRRKSYRGRASRMKSSRGLGQGGVGAVQRLGPHSQGVCLLAMSRQKVCWGV